MKIITLTKGLPASGKTTFAKSLVQQTKGGTIRVTPGDLREMLHENNWSKENEQMVIRIRDHIIIEGLLAGYNIIVDDTNLNPMVEYEIRKQFSHIATIKTKDFTHVSLETCLKRNNARERKLPEKVIIDMHEKYINK